MSESRLVQLERRVDLVLKGFNLILFGEAETVSRKEKRELEMRLSDYVKGKRSEFVELKDLQDRATQKGD